MEPFEYDLQILFNQFLTLACLVIFFQNCFIFLLPISAIQLRAFILMCILRFSFFLILFAHCTWSCIYYLVNSFACLFLLRCSMVLLSSVEPSKSEIGKPA